MADNKRDIELRIAATTSGSEAIVKLSDVLDSLAKEAGDAGPKFTELADAVRRIGEQGDAVAVLDRLEQQVKQTSESFGTARERADALGQQLVEQRATTERFAVTQQKAQQAVDQTRQALIQNQTALSNLNAQYDRAGKATVGYKNQADPLRETIRQLGLQLKQQRFDLELANRAYSEQSTALRKIDSDYTKAATAAGKLDTSLKQQNASLEQAQQQLTQLGVESTQAATAIEKVEAALAGTQREAQQAEAAYKQLQAVTEAVAKSNERNVAIAQRAAAAREAAAQRQVAAERAAASAAEAAALRSRLAQQQLEGQLRETEAAQKSLNDAFAATGVRSAQAIESEIRQIVASLAALRNNANVSGAEFDRAFKSAETRVEALKRELAGLPPLVRETSNTAAILRQSFSQLTAAFGAFEVGRGFITANIQLETMRRSLTLVTGSAEEAQRQIALLREVANQAGISVGSISDAFVRFQASLNGAGVPLATTEAVFRSVINAAGQLGQSSERTSLVLDALAQIAAKGVVSMEELRQQLGDSLPGALSIAAKGLGVTTDQLVQLVETGEIAAADFLPAFAAAMTETFGKGEKEVEGLLQAFNRLKNTLAELSQVVGDEGGFMQIASDRMNELTAILRGTVAALDFLARGVNILNEASANLDLTSPFESGRVAREKLIEQFNVLRERFANLDGEAKKTNQTIAANGDASTGAAQAQGALAQSTEATTAAAAEGARQWTRLKVAYSDVLEQTRASIVETSKLAEAKKLEGETLVALAELSGNELESRKASAQAATSEAAAIEKSLLSRNKEIAILTDQRDKMIEVAAQLGDPSGSRQKEIDKLTATITLRTAEAAKVKETIDATKLEAAARQLAVETYGDQSAALDVLKKAYDNANLALQATIKLQQEGKATDADVIAAKELAARAEAKYKDALEDTAAALERTVRAAQGSLSVTEAQINLERAKIETEIASAKATGDSAGVLQGTIELKQLDIKLIQAKIEALRIEAQALRAEAQAALDALQANDPLLEQKRAEIQLRLQNAKAKELEAARNAEVIKQINNEIELMRQRGVESSNTANQYVNDRSREAEAMDRVTAATERAAEAERKRRGVDKEGFSTDKNGNRISAYGATWLSIFNQLKGYGLDDAQARSIAGEFTDSNGNVQFTNNPGQLKYGGQNSTLDFAILKAAEQAIRRGTSGTSGGGAQLSPSTVNVNLNGQRTSVGLASPEEAAKLLTIFSAINESANRSGP